MHISILGSLTQVFLLHELFTGALRNTVASGSFMSPQLRTVHKKNVVHWLRSGRKIEVELDVKLKSNWM